MSAAAPLTAASPEAATDPERGRRPRVGPSLRTSLAPSLGLLPFLVFVGIFLVVPTVTVVVGAFQADTGGFSLEKIRALGEETPLRALRESVILSFTSAVVGAVLGALLAYLVVTAPPTSVMRRGVTAVCGVLAQFGGVTLAFAWMATLGFGGLLTGVMADAFGADPNGSAWLYELPGLILVYSYFQIPLMVIVFLPALEGLRPQWREAAVNLGATTRQYWTQVAFPLLRPAFLGSALLLFANAFAAYATAAALVSQGAPITPLLIRSALTSEIVLGQANFGYALAFQMVVVVAVVMSLYAWLLRRTSRWLS
jgi:putative spermidine/putrescine transport system permease protein